MVGYRLSRTGIAGQPFFIQSIGINLWSVEELCWFLEHHPALIDETIIGTKLTRWLSEEFGLTEMALRMERGLRDGRGAAEYLMPLFTLTGYMTHHESLKMRAVLEKFTEATAAERSFRKGNALAANRKYGEAIASYEQAAGLTHERERGFLAKIFHNAGTAAMQLLEYDEAEAFFLKAYQADGTHARLRDYLTAARLAKPEERYFEEAEIAGADEEVLAEVDSALKAAREQRPELPEDLQAAVRKLRLDYHREAGTSVRGC